MTQSTERSLAYRLAITQKCFSEMTTDELSRISGSRFDGSAVFTTGDGNDPAVRDTDSYLQIDNNHV